MPSKTTPQHMFYKRSKDTSRGRKDLNTVVKDYKILFAVCLVSGLPFLPYNVLKPNDENCFFVFIFAILSALGTLVSCTSLFYTHIVFKLPSTELTFQTFSICSLISWWCLFFKRRKIKYAVKLFLDIISEVNWGRFKSKWKIHVFLLIHILSASLITTAFLYAGLFNVLEFKGNSISFLWHKFDGEQLRIFLKVLEVSSVLSYSMCASSCGLVALMYSTIYFHLGDVILSFGEKLKKSFQNEDLNLNTMSGSVEIFQKILHLNEAIDDAFASSVLFFYGATISSFMNVIAIVRGFDCLSFAVSYIVTLVFFFSLYNFLVVTVIGNRVKKMNVALRQCVIECSRQVILRNPPEKKMTAFSLMADDIRSTDLCVSGGLFIIGKELMLTVTGALITYGVIVFQMDND